MLKKITICTVSVISVMIPFISFAQDPGGNPDGNPPPVVPFDDNMNLILIGIGVALAVVVFKRLQGKRIANS